MITDFLRNATPQQVKTIALQDVMLLYSEMNQRALNLLIKQQAMQERPDDRRTVLECELAGHQYAISQIDFHELLKQHLG